MLNPATPPETQTCQPPPSSLTHILAVIAECYSYAHAYAHSPTALRTPCYSPVHTLSPPFAHCSHPLSTRSIPLRNQTAKGTAPVQFVLEVPFFALDFAHL